MDRHTPLLVAAVTLLLYGCSHAQTQPARFLPASAPGLAEINRQSDEWFKSDAGQRALDNIVSWQNENGGWWKTYDPTIPRPAQLPPSNPANGPPGDNEPYWLANSTN